VENNLILLSTDVSLLKRAFTLWRQLQARIENNEVDCTSLKLTDEDSLLTMTGILSVGRIDSDIVQSTMRCAKEQNLPFELLTAAQVRDRYPVFHLHDDDVAVFEAEAGYLNPELCIGGYLTSAEQDGAELHFNEPVINWYKSLTDDHFEVQTKNSNYSVKKIVFTAGGWASSLYGDELKLNLYTEGRLLVWFKPRFEDTESAYLSLKRFKVLYRLVFYCFLEFCRIFLFTFGKQQMEIIFMVFLGNLVARVVQELRLPGITLLLIL
jgi:glycine/D-amino acid oxidase-like deaminating enzyme